MQNRKRKKRRTEGDMMRDEIMEAIKEGGLKR